MNTQIHKSPTQCRHLIRGAAFIAKAIKSVLATAILSLITEACAGATAPSFKPGQAPGTFEPPPPCATPCPPPPTSSPPAGPIVVNPSGCLSVDLSISVDQIFAHHTTDNDHGALNDRDEVYFVVAGATSDSIIDRPRVSPPPPEDYYGLKDGESTDNIPLWQGSICSGKGAYMVVGVEEQDNAQLEVIEGTVRAAAEDIALAIAGDLKSEKVIDQLGEIGLDFVHSLSADGDDNIGSFTIMLTNEAETVTTQWSAGDNTTIGFQSSDSATFEAKGSGADYTVRVSILK